MSDDMDRLEGYPDEILRALIETAENNYRDKVDEHGPGKNWLDDEARWHIWKACDEMFQARDHAHSGRPYQTRRCLADALNHMLFSMEIVYNNHNVQPDTGRGESE